jgi:hypothetical protein
LRRKARPNARFIIGIFGCRLVHFGGSGDFQPKSDAKSLGIKSFFPH